jgi:tRNA A-37 threonylcarbamoyl transferase component Bud32
MQLIKNLEGLSGCKVSLYSKNNLFFIRKISKSLEYNSRLISQINLQNNFKSLNIKTPKIYNTGFTDNIFYCDMEYINGITFGEFIEYKSFIETQSIFNKIIDNILGLNNHKVQNPEPFLIKLNEVSKYTENVNLLNYLSKNIPTYLNEPGFHGDITFENIIISNKNEIFLIDFLDSFVNDIYLDFSKLLQEFKLLWSFRNRTIDYNIAIKYNKLSEIFNKKIDLLIDTNKLNFCFYLNLLRIIPYSKEKDKILINKILNE